MALRINIPPLTRVLLILLVGLSLVYQAASYRERRSGATTHTGVPWLALTPQLSVYYPWVYLTSTFAERNVATLLVAGATVFYGGKYLERAWGSAEFGKFFLVATLIPNVTAALLYVLVFAITRADAQA